MPAPATDDLFPGKTPGNASMGSSRLIRALVGLDIAAVAHSRREFADRLAQLIDFADSISLSTVHARLPGMAFEPTGESGEVLVEEFLRRHKSMVQTVIDSFAPASAHTRIRLPPTEQEPPRDATAAFAPYQRFYAAHQRQIDFNSRSLQAHVRKTVAGLTPRLARLGALDAAVGDTLAAHARQCFATVPALLGERFARFVDQCRPTRNTQQGTPASWPPLQQQFCGEMRETLLAEIDARLLPTLGLLEAIHDTVEPATYD